MVGAVITEVVGTEKAGAKNAELECNDCRVVPGLGALGCRFAFGGIFACGFAGGLAIAAARARALSLPRCPGELYHMALE